MRQSKKTAGLRLAGIIVIALAVPANAHAQGGPFADIQAQLAAITAQLAQLDAITAQLDAIAAAAAHEVYVPFNVQVPAGLCDSGPSPSSNPQIIIDSDGTGTFSVTSILLKRGFMNPVDFLFLSVNTVAIDGTGFDTRTGNLIEPIGGEFGVLQGVDLLGTAIRPNPVSAEMGGNLPHQIVANGDGGADIFVQLFCRSDAQDMNLEVIHVSGWKQREDTISVTYIPGN